MCRFIAYLGPDVTLDTLITRPRNSLIHQSFDNEERVEPLNGDGFGVGWYAPDVAAEPAVFREITPAWNNPNLGDLARLTRSGCVFAHVRAASPGLAVTRTNCHPFRAGPLLFMHNGTVGAFQRIRRAMLRTMSDASFRAIGGTTDSEHLFGLVLDRYAGLEENAPAERLARALELAMAAVTELAREADPDDRSQLNLAVTDGQAAAFTRFCDGDAEGANSLYVHRGCRYAFDGERCAMVEPDAAGSGCVIVSSERLSDDAGWDRVPGNHLVVVAPDRTITMRAIAAA